MNRESSIVNRQSSFVNGQSSVTKARSSSQTFANYLAKVKKEMRLAFTLPVKAAAACFCFAVFLLLVTSCNSPYTPKPTGYFKISFPPKKYRLFSKPGYPYTFEYPVYANVVKDSTFFKDSTENPWWININFPQFNGRIYVSYKVIGQYKLDKLLNDAFNLTNKHSEKADYIGDSLLSTPNGVHGMFFRVEGDVATANQFFLTDSTKNFLRGALYFDATPNQDSLKPVNDFLVEDMMHLVNTFKWVTPQTP